MITGLAVDTRTLTARIGIAHAAKCRAIARGNVCRKRQALFSQCIIKLVEYDSGLYSDPLRFTIPLKYPIHVTRTIQDHTLGQ